MSVTQLNVAPAVEFSWVEPAALHSAWPAVRPDLETCLGQDRDGLWPEDVYARLRTGEMTLYVGKVREQYVGFIVAQLLQDPDGRGRLHVHYANGAGFVAQAQEWLEGLARHHHVKRITFRATRPGFSRLAPRLGYKPVATEYELRTEH